MRPDHSVILCFDKLQLDELSTVEDQISAVKKYYKVIPLLELVERVADKKVRGFASICFKYPRKGLQNWLTGYPMENKVPVTVFLDVDCIGTNRLPRQERGQKPMPLPIEQLSPFDFMMTWGRLAELPPDWVSFGLQLVGEDPAKWKEEKTFAERQVKREVKLSFSPQVTDLSGKEFIGCVIGQVGKIDPKANPFALPIWNG